MALIGWTPKTMQNSSIATQVSSLAPWEEGDPATNVIYFWSNEHIIRA